MPAAIVNPDPKRPDFLPPCPLCASPSRFAFTKSGYAILDCIRCGHRFCGHAPAQSHIVETYGDAYFQGGGAGYPDYLAEGALLRAQGSRYGDILRKHASPGTLLDVGCSAGFIMKGLSDRGWQVKGVEPNPKMAEFGRGNLGLEIHTGAFEEYPSMGFSALTLIQVLPHFIRPREAILKANQLLLDDGLFLVETWDRDSLTARAFGRHWHEYSPPSVLHWFSKRGLERLAGECGFLKVAQGRPAKRINAAHAFSLMAHKMEGFAGRWVRGLAGRILPANLPLWYPADDVFWMLFRKADRPSTAS